MMLNKVDDEEKELIQIGTLNNAYSAWFLTEQGLYEVLFQSRKPIAKAFKKEVKKILKQIRNFKRNKWRRYQTFFFFILKKYQTKIFYKNNKNILRFRGEDSDNSSKIFFYPLCIYNLHKKRKGEDIMKNAIINLRVNGDLKKAFKIASMKQGKTMTEALEELMRKAIIEQENNK